MAFLNEKKMYLSKHDKSKKGDIDTRVVPILSVINKHPDYYTTSSCSGRVYLWTGTGKKNQTEWLKVSHDLIEEDFLNASSSAKGLFWLRVEPFILHVACKNLEAANRLLEKARQIYKKSCILSASNKIIIEIRGSELIEMPFFLDGKNLFAGDYSWLVRLVNERLEHMWRGMDIFKKKIT